MRRRRRLQLVAAPQHGLFTTQQAASAGLDRRARHHHLTYGNWRRTEAPGVFRLVSWPDDELERLRAWLLWGGKGAALTSWTALDRHGLTVAGPRTPVDLVLPPARSWEAQRHRTAQLRALSRLTDPDCDAPVVLPSPVMQGPPVRLHRGVDRSRAAVTLGGLAVRPAAEAICLAVAAQPDASISLRLLDALIAGGHLRRHEVLLAAVATGSTRVRDHLFARPLRSG